MPAKVAAEGEDIVTWTKCFTLYTAVMSKERADMVPPMMAHLHTEYKLFQRAPTTKVWLEYDIQFRMEAATSEDRCWSSADSWQFLSCLPGPILTPDPLKWQIHRAQHLSLSRATVQAPLREPSGRMKPMDHLP